MTNDIEAAARAWIASEVDAYPGESMDDRIASWMCGGVHPDDVGRFLVDAYSAGYCAALAHAARGGMETSDISIPCPPGVGLGCHATPPPATGEPDHRGEDREAVEAARRDVKRGEAS